MSLELHGTGSTSLILLIAGVISLVLTAWGVSQLLNRRWWIGSAAIAGAGGPIPLLGVMVFRTVLAWTNGNGAAGRRALTVSLAAGGFSVAAFIIAAAIGTGDAWYMVLLLAQVTIAVGIFYCSVYGHLGNMRIAVLMALRTAAILVLMLLLFKPVLMVMPDRESRLPHIAVAVDSSGSMSTRDARNNTARYDRVTEVLEWQRENITENFRPVYIHFADAATAANSPVRLKYVDTARKESTGTRIAAALTTVAEKLPASGGAGIFLFSDGVDNSGLDPVTVATRIGVPLYTVAVGTPVPPVGGRANIRLLSIDAPPDAVPAHNTKVTAKIGLHYFEDVPFRVRLFEGDAQVFSREIKTTDGETECAMEWKPARDAGDGALPPIRRLRVEAVPVNRDTEEFSTNDNAHEVHVLMTNPKIRTLCIEGTIRPEYKYLKRTLQTDTNVQFCGLVRIAENRFWAQGDIDGRKPEGLPKTEADFNLFDVIIIGDLDSSFLAAGQMELFRSFVEKGGGLLMIGGRNSFGPGGYGGTPIETALPVIFGSRDVGQAAAEFVPRLTAAGKAHPVFTGIADLFPAVGSKTKDPASAAIKPLKGMVKVRQAKPGAAVLALHPELKNAAGPLPVLATERYGEGRSAAFSCDTTWRWYLAGRGLGRESPYTSFWSQLVRWLASEDATERELGSSALLRLDRTHIYTGEGTINAIAYVRNKDGQPAPAARATLTVSPAGGGKPRKISMESAAAPGVLKSSWRPREPGEYTVELTADDRGGKRLGTDSMPVTVLRKNTELQNLAVNERILKRLADATGGRFVDLEEFPDLLDALIDQTRIDPEKLQPDIHRLFNFPLLFFLFVILLTGEWLLRRYWQLQ